MSPRSKMAHTSRSFQSTPFSRRCAGLNLHPPALAASSCPGPRGVLVRDPQTQAQSSCTGASERALDSALSCLNFCCYWRLLRTTKGKTTTPGAGLGLWRGLHLRKPRQRACSPPSHPGQHAPRAPHPYVALSPCLPAHHGAPTCPQSSAQGLLLC